MYRLHFSPWSDTLQRCVSLLSLPQCFVWRLLSVTSDCRKHSPTASKTTLRLYIFKHVCLRACVCLRDLRRAVFFSSISKRVHSVQVPGDRPMGDQFFGGVWKTICLAGCQSVMIPPVSPLQQREGRWEGGESGRLGGRGQRKYCPSSWQQKGRRSISVLRYISNSNYTPCLLSAAFNF